MPKAGAAPKAATAPKAKAAPKAAPKGAAKSKAAAKAWFHGFKLGDAGDEEKTAEDSDAEISNL